MLTSEIANMYEACFPTVVCDLHTGEIVWVNQLLETMFGYHMRNALRGKSVDSLLPLTKRAMHAKHREAYAEKPEMRSMGVGLELQGCRKDGSEFPVVVMLAAFVDENDRRLAVAIVSQLREEANAKG
jgi:PAS domain S-box-containing protein